MVSCTSATCACAAVFNYCYAKHHNPTLPPPQHSDLYLYSYIPTFNIHLCNKNGGGHQGTLDYTMTMWKTMLKRWSAIWLCCTVPLAPHHAPLLPVTVPSSPSLSPPPHHCPLLPITVPSSPSLSPPSHHCPPPSHHCPLRPLLPITVPSVLSFPSLSPPPHHCPLLPITVPSFPSLSPPSHHCPLLPITVPSSPSHHVIMAYCFFPLLSRYSLLPPI